MALLAFLTLLAFLALLTLAFLSLLLAFLALLPLLPLLLPLGEAPVHRFQAANEFAGFLERLLERVHFTLAGGTCRPLELVAQGLQVRLDVELEGDRGLRVPLLDRAARVLQLLFQLGLADLRRGFLERASGSRIVGPAVRGGLIQFALEVLNRLVHLVLAFTELVDGFPPLSPSRWKPPHVPLDLSLLPL